MARMRVFIVLALAIAAGGTFAFGTYRYMQNVPTQTASVPTSGVVVAAADLQLGAELKRRGPSRHPVAGGRRADGVRSRSRRNWSAAASFMPVASRTSHSCPGKLAPKEAGAGLPPVIAPGFPRAVGARQRRHRRRRIRAARQPASTSSRPSTRRSSRTDVTSKVILTNVLVLASGTKIERDVEGNKPISVSVVTLLVNPDEAERLTLASTEGKIQLALRNPMDQTAPQTRGIKSRGVDGFGDAIAPVRRVAANTALLDRSARPAPLPTVEIIRGDKRAQEAVTQE